MLRAFIAHSQIFRHFQVFFQTLCIIFVRLYSSRVVDMSPYYGYDGCICAKTNETAHVLVK